jgi:hypothetical protein
MQDRRYRPGDVLDDYCPRERRITDHAIVAMIDDEIRRTRCGSCDAEHEYKEAKVPSPRRKTQPPALFTQVLEGMNGPVAKPHPAAAEGEPDAAASIDEESIAVAVEDEPIESPVLADARREPEPVTVAAGAEDETPAEEEENRDEGGFFRRSLIRATFPRPEGQAPPDRKIPEFTIQSLQNRRNGAGQRHAGAQHKFRGARRRPAGGGSQDHLGPMRFRDHGHGQSNNGQGQGQGQGGGRRRRGGTKNRRRRIRRERSG